MSRFPASRIVSFCLVACAAATPLNAAADEYDVLNFFVGHIITYDDNLFRIPPGTTILVGGKSQRSDIINTSYVGLNLNKPVSRQRFIVDAQINVSRFNEYSQFNNDGRNIRARWLWELGNRLKGEVLAENTRSLTSFVDFRDFVKNTIDYQRLYANGSYWFHPEWALAAGASAYDTKNSAPLRRINDYHADYVEAGAQFKPPSGNLIGLKLRRTESKFPNREPVSGFFVDNSFTQDDLELNADWRLSGESRLSGRAGLTRLQHKQVKQRDFRGPTGVLAYDWTPTDKTSLNLTLRRDVWAADDVNASYVLTNGISVAPKWTPTAKLTFQGKLDYRRRDHRGDPGFFIGTGPQQEDRFRTASLTASYLPLRSLQLSLTLQKERRDSNIPSIVYDDKLGFASAQFTF